MPFEFGDVVLVPFPFTSHIASKKRPAVVVGNQPITPPGPTWW
jgi:mRNA-degrading endonuclease toxin of MazEF toxin-antitoxin module